MLLRTTLAGLISVQAITLPESYHEIGVDKIQACGKLENFFNENNPASQHFTEIEKYPLYNYQVVYQTTKKGRSGLYVKCKRVKKRKVSAADWTAFKNWKATEIWRNRTARFLCDRKGNWKIKRNIPTCANFTGSDNGWDSLLNPVEAPVLDNDALFQNEAANSNDGSFDDTPPIDNRQYITAGQTCNTENGGVDRWTDWASRDNGGQSGTGEYEQLFRLLDEKPEIVNCTAPIGVKARKVDINDVTDIWYQSHRFGPDYGFVCQNVNHPDNLCDDVELSFCCSGCGELFENCQVCLADNSGCFEYSKDYTTQQVEEQFSYLGTTSGCSTCNKCVVTAADNTGNNPFPTVTAHYPEGSSTPSNVDLKGYPEAGCAFRTYFDQQYDELWLEYEVYFPADFDFVKGGKMPGLFGGSVYSGCNLPDGTNGFSTRYMWGENGYWYLYLYAVENADLGYSCGQDLGKGMDQFPKGEWIKIKQFIRLNDVGQNNGIAAVFINDQIKFQKTSITYRTVDTLKIEGFLFSTFFGGSSPEWRATKDEEVSFKNVQIYTNPYQVVTDDLRTYVYDFDPNGPQDCGISDTSRSWTAWNSRDSGGTGTGEYEQLHNFRKPDSGFLGTTCDNPTGAQVRLKDNIFSDLTPVPYGNRFEFDYGWVCKNDQHPVNYCEDIEISFCCPN